MTAADAPRRPGAGRRRRRRRRAPAPASSASLVVLAASRRWLLARARACSLAQLLRDRRPGPRPPRVARAPRTIRLEGVVEPRTDRAHGDAARPSRSPARAASDVRVRSAGLAAPALPARTSPSSSSATSPRRRRASSLGTQIMVKHTATLHRPAPRPGARAERVDPVTLTWLGRARALRRASSARWAASLAQLRRAAHGAGARTRWPGRVRRARAAIVGAVGVDAVRARHPRLLAGLRRGEQRDLHAAALLDHRACGRRSRARCCCGRCCSPA